ncbi:MAG: OadG-related small transporter subunit [Chloroflexota bacterium]
MNPVTHGLMLTVVGMGLVFLALVIFLVSIVVLKRLFPSRSTVGADEIGEAVGSGVWEPTQEEAAAIGAALAIWMSRPAGAGGDARLGQTLAAGASPWGVAARHPLPGPWQSQ